MSEVHMLKNTDKTYPCVQCGSKNASIIREGADPRMKCNQCNFLYDASASTQAVEAGAIPDGPPALEDPNPPASPTLNPRTSRRHDSDSSPPPNNEAPIRASKVPRAPSYVFISKDRTRTEFATQRTVKTIAFRWQYEDIKYDLFALTPKKIAATIDIS